MVIKTREKLIDVARQLFAYKGVENTTMNDIAAASEKGRRTIYTYFKNKREIYNAVIERESDRLICQLREVADSNMPPEIKLEKYLMLRFNVVVDRTPKHDTLRYIFGRDYRRIERIWRLAIDKESVLFKKVLNEGVAAGVYDAEQASRLPVLEALMFQGIDYCHMRDNFDSVGPDINRIRDEVIKFIIQGIKK